MDSKKTGALIAKIRKDKNMTQNELAILLHLSDKTISKWERGQGCPDISLLNSLAEVLGVHVSDILTGEFSDNDNNGGNMKKTRFYVCQECGNIITSSDELQLTCCGQKLNSLEAQKPDGESHDFVVEQIEDETFISAKHDMNKDHFISFVACVTSDRLILNRLYPEQSCEVRFKIRGHGILYLYCNVHGLFQKRI